MTINFCVRCGSSVGLVAPCRCEACGYEFWRNPKPCGGACVTDYGKLLLVRRALEPAAGYWDLPGGFCEADEHPWDTARREVLEETGLNIRSTGFLGMWVDAYGDDEPPEITLNIYFLAKAEAPELVTTTEEASEVRWFEPNEIPHGMLAFDHVRQAIQQWGSRQQ